MYKKSLTSRHLQQGAVYYIASRSRRAICSESFSLSLSRGRNPSASTTPTLQEFRNYTFHAADIYTYIYI